MRKQKGFTLIELLVVIAIIALLLSILMPSLQKVKKQAQTVVGRSNHKQLYLALSMYVEDNNNKIWRGYVYDPDSCYSTAQVSNWWMPALVHYAGEIPKIRFCPTATKLRYQENGSDHGVGWGKEPFTAWGYSPNFLDPISPYPNCDTGSYAVNGWIEDGWDDCGSNRSRKFWRRSNKISQADKVPFLVDAQWIDAWPEANDPPPDYENDMWGSNPGNWDRIVQNRHNGRENIIFMDGSARPVGLKEMWTLKWHRNYNTKGKYTIAGGATRSLWESDALWMAGFKDY